MLDRKPHNYISKRIPTFSKTVKLLPDIDFLSYNNNTNQIIGVEVKVIYVDNLDKLNRRFYQGMDQSLALLLYGLDKVIFLQAFVLNADLYEKKNQNEKINDKVLNMSMRSIKIIKELRDKLNLVIGYTPVFDVLRRGNFALKCPFVLESKGKNRVEIILEPKDNPFAKEEPYSGVRKELIKKYFPNAQRT